MRPSTPPPSGGRAVIVFMYSGNFQLGNSGNLDGSAFAGYEDVIFVALEDDHLRKKYPAGAGDASQAFDLMAALKWSKSVGDEGGDDYAFAVKWCFTGASGTNQSWQGAIIKNVVRPLEICEEHFKTVAIS
jgi:hypothetical protein